MTDKTFKIELKGQMDINNKPLYVHIIDSDEHVYLSNVDFPDDDEVIILSKGHDIQKLIELLDKLKV